MHRLQVVVMALVVGTVLLPAALHANVNVCAPGAPQACRSCNVLPLGIWNPRVLLHFAILHGGFGLVSCDLRRLPRWA